ncbi:MAG TPA: L,D-transpeptidase family protein [Microvirga sp.]|jgi:murein L,D-transpeptidase YcbB/YkuD|nr:L,D-transpeptidase family protein [Microvirga sp.]
MGQARSFVLGLGVLCSASLLGLSAASQTLEAPAEAPTQPALAAEAPPSPDLGLAPPDLPAAVVTLTPDDRLQAALAAALGRLGDVTPQLPRREREALAAFYRDAKPLWVEDGGWTRAAEAVVARLKAADEDGLDPDDYRIPVLGGRSAAGPADWAEAELKLSAAALLYARDARGGRIEPWRLSNHLTPKLALPDPAEVLARLREARDPGAALAAYNPQHSGYRALKARLAELRSTRRTPAAPMVQVPRGPTLKVGMRDPRVPLIRARFKIGPAAGDAAAYDEQVASAVAAFQKEKGLPASGILNAQTLAALGGGPSPARLEGDLVANMERWRWLPTELGQRHILVNVPEYRLRLLDRGEVVHQTRVIVGKTESPTPVFSDEMEHVIVNPSWTLPPSILKNEFLPALAADPTYAERKGYRIIRRGGTIAVQQPPGERNALGLVKFIFPNDHAVYLHDTPNRSLFGAERRAFSHGCVRVDKPFLLAEAILKTEGSWPEERLRGLVGKGERYIRVRQLPVHLAYFTLQVDERGELKSFDDIYGFHRKVKQALGLEG